jgi:hypothetical protein
MAEILAGAEPFSSVGSADVGALVLDGFTGNPQSMRARSPRRSPRPAIPSNCRCSPVTGRASRTWPRRKKLSSIAIPAVLLHSQRGHVVAVSSTELAESELPGPVERVDLPNGFHVATSDLDKAEINRRSVAFAETVAQP